MKKAITIDYLCYEKEGQYLDRKSARIKTTSLAQHISAFANANGGTLVIGIEDDGEITGLDCDKATNINELLDVPLSLCEAPVKYETEIRKIDDKEILIFNIEPSNNKVIRTSKKEVYLRIGDKSKKLDHEQINQLEYDKGERSFEDVLIEDSNFEDVDLDVLNTYKKILNTDSSFENILESRGFMKNGHLTVAGILLFSKHPTKFFPGARLRLIKYDGVKMETGRRLNIIKEITFDSAIPKIIQDVRAAINLQIRDFQFLDSDGTFTVIPEYPEFAWFEGIVNSLTHRNYSLNGDCIKVFLYDDRLEILSPGKLPNIVSLENMMNTRYSRNPRIARTLIEFGWVKELNEGVKRIYDEMQSFYLKSPEYSEPNNNVLLILENSITSRALRSVDRVFNEIDENILLSLNDQEIKIIQYLMSNDKITVKIAKDLINKSESTARTRLQNLEKLGTIVWYGSSKRDPTQFYSLNKKYK